MTPEQLKASILQYAIQGKLVEQRPEEGTAEDLYKAIQEEKQKLIKEGKFKKEKPLSEITEDEMPFDIPDSWKWVRIGDIYSLTMGQSPDGNSVSKGLDGMEFHQGKVFFGKDYIQKSDQVTSQPSKIAEPNSVLLCVRAPVGIVNITDRELCIGRGLCAIKPLAGMTEKYALYSLRCLKEEFIKKATGTTFVAITGEVVKNQLIPLPPLAEQHRIVAKIEELLPFVERYAASYEKLEQFNAKFPEDMKKSILQYAIQGKLVKQRPEEGTAEDLYKAIQEEKKQYKIKTIETNPMEEPPFDIPDSWKWIQLQDIVKKTIKRGKSPKYTENSNIQVFAQKCNVKTGGINMELAQYLDLNAAEKYPDEEYMVNGDIIINSTGGGTMGRVGIFHDTDRLNNMKIVPDGHVTIIRACDMVDYKYLYYFIKHNQKYLETQGEGSTNQTELKPITIASLALPLPPLEEQHRIVAKIEELLPYCDQLIK